MLTDNPETLPRLSRRVAMNSAAVFFCQLTALVANAVVTVLLARYLGQNGFGLFSYALVFVSLFAIVADFGMQTILVREIARQGSNPAALLGNAVIIKIVLSFFAIALTIIVAWGVGFHERLFGIIAILAFSIPVTSKFYTLRVIFEAQFNASLSMETPVLFQLLDSLILVGVTYGLTRFGATLEMLVAGYVLSNVPGLCLTIYASTRKFPFRFAINWELIRSLLRESFPLCMYTILMSLAGSVDVLFLRELQGEGAVGLYSAALRLTSPLLIIPHGVVVSLLPLLSRYYKQSEEKLSMTFHLGMKMILLVALALAIATTFLGAEIIHIFYSDEYNASIAPLIILMWGQAVLFLSFFFANALASVNRQQITLFSSATMLLTNGVASWILINVFGVQGAATAKLLSILAGAAMLFVPVSRIFALQLNQLLFRTVVFGISFATVLALLHRAHIGIFFFASLALLTMLVISWGVLNKEERVIFLSVMRAPLPKR